jgi:hypothetical protein
MRHKGYHRREVALEVEVEREVELPQGDAYVIYRIAVGCETEPGGGDGWNEPKYGPSASVFDIKVLSTRVTLGDDDEIVKVYVDGFIGPIETGLVRPGHSLDLLESEQRDIEEKALEEAWTEPDPDDEYERRMDL